MNTPLWNSEDAATATNGSAEGSWTASGVSIDTRSLDPGDLFIAIKGANFDGHDFLDAAYAAGATAALVEKGWAVHCRAATRYHPLLLVGDTMEGLRRLGTGARTRTSATVIAVTGSVGKTGVKEALAALLSAQGKTGHSSGSFNNHIGVPLSMARLAPDARFWVLELGMNHAGEMTDLSRQARPDVAVINNVEAVHTAHFDDEKEIAEAKAEIFLGLKAGGTAILNRDNPHFPFLAERAWAAGAGSVICFGEHEEADFRLREFNMGADGSTVNATYKEHDLAYRLNLAGRHWVQNSLAVLATIEAAGADIFAGAAAMEDLSPAPGRGRRHTIDTGGIYFVIIDESYNASPVSVAASLAVLGTLPGKRRIAVLGDMLELGIESDSAHRGLVGAIVANGVDQVYTAGERMAHLFRALSPEFRGGHFENAEELAEPLLAALQSGDVVLVKGSAGSRMGIIVAALRSYGEKSNAV
ncbi:MAG: UDP-N-acetylmuramoyl-tripeptide--D-alanyl-D-alanine ligase [Pseudomonadota bacterium]|nr:UDP-N-acetylmuramoyl-tripeptide--D-alanyl-D-alanine ligase [Pseudomonadota bacterium]